MAAGTTHPALPGVEEEEGAKDVEEGAGSHLRRRDAASMSGSGGSMERRRGLDPASLPRIRRGGAGGEEEWAEP